MPSRKQAGGLCCIKRRRRYAAVVYANKYHMGQPGCPSCKSICSHVQQVVGLRKRCTNPTWLVGPSGPMICGWREAIDERRCARSWPIVSGAG